MKLAPQLFIRWQSRALFYGNAMIAGSVQNGNCKEVVAFIGVISECSYAGLVDEDFSISYLCLEYTASH
jgi:hypothetical protein